jgi:HK97 family phage major capsid protein/HK97 family phage prohead protease
MTMDTRTADVLRMQREDGTMYRTAAVTVAPASEETQTRAVSLAISSEMPVLRYDYRTGEFFYEVLAHDASAVDLSRAANGLPLLRGHDQRDVVGRAMNITVDADSVLRASDVKFSRSEDGRAAMMDVEDGILTDTSVGYVVGDTYTEEKRDGDDYATRTYTRWTPFEVSLVAVPADPSVGVGRSANAAPVLSIQVAEPQERIMSVNTEAPATEGRADFILSACAAAGVDAEKAREFIASSKTHSEITRELVDAVAARHAAKPSVAVDLTEKDQRTYSVVSALRNLADGKRSGFEFEVSDTIAKQMGRDTAGFYMPTNIAAQNPAMKPNAEVRTLLSVGDKANTKGGEGVFTEYGGFIDLLRARMVTTSLGAQFVGGLQGDLSFVNQSAAGTFSWGSETANAGLSSLSTGVRTMAPKVGQSASSITRQILRQASFDVENLVRNDIAAVHAIGIDNAAINGTGSSNQPRGVVATAGIGAVVGGANGAAPTYAHAVALQKEVAIDNALAGNLGYLTHPNVAAALMLTQQFSGTNGAAVWSGNILDGQVGGFRAMSSTQVQAGLTKGSASGTIAHWIFGDWSSLLIGEWGAMEMIVDPYTSGPATIILRSIQMVDVFLRYPEKFSAMLDVVAA